MTSRDNVRGLRLHYHSPCNRLQHPEKTGPHASTSTPMPHSDSFPSSFPKDTDHAINELRKHGAVHMKQLLPKTSATDLHDEYQHGLADVLQRTTRGRLLSIGIKRLHATLPFRGAFLSPGFCGNTFIHELCHRLMGKHYIVSTLAVAVSFPGAPRQHRHRDQEIIFDDPKLNLAMPPVSICVGIPLAATSSHSELTEFALGSHTDQNYSTHYPDENSAPFSTPEISLGDAVIWDNRTIHRGRANASPYARPLLLMYIQQPWFNNYNIQGDAALQISPDDLQHIPQEVRKHFAWPHQLRHNENRITDPVMRSSACPCGSELRFKHCCGKWLI